MYSCLSSRDYYEHIHLSLEVILQVIQNWLVLEKELLYKLQCVIWIGNGMSNSSRIVEYFIIISTLFQIFVKSNKTLERVKTNLMGFITEEVNLVEMFISHNSQCVCLVPTIGKDVNWNLTTYCKCQAIIGELLSKSLDKRDSISHFLQKRVSKKLN